MKPLTKRLSLALVGALAVTAAAGVVSAQIWRGGYGRRFPPRFPTSDTFQGAFNFCRLMFTSNRREKTGWRTDYPGADINFSVRLSELTKAPVTMDGEGEPDYAVVQATDDALFKCGFALVEDGGTADFSQEEVTRLREYLLKGGFLFVTDYWGDYARQQWDQEISRALPEYPIVDIPMGHPVWHMMFDLQKVPQMSSIQSWRRGGGTTERWARGEPVDVRGIADDHGHLMVLMVHNDDIPDGWEREAEEPAYFMQFSPDAYAVGINVILYAMTH